MKALHLFSGVGGGALGFQRAGFQSVGAFDIDAPACRDLEYLTGELATVADLGKMSSGELRAACTGRPDVVFTSPPCLPSGSQIVTADGDRPIEQIEAGDLILTHKGRYRHVRKVNSRMFAGEMIRVQLAGSCEWHEFTDEHPLLMRRVRRGTKKRYLAPSRFVPARDVRLLDRLGFPIAPGTPGCARSWVESFGDPQVTNGKRHPRVVDLRPHAESPALWFLLGVYVADGYRRHDRTEVNFCVGAVDGEEANEVRKSLTQLGVGWSEDLNGGPTNIKLRSSAKHLHMLTSAFGDLAHKKGIPQELMSLESQFIHDLWRGYRWDGHHEPRRVVQTQNRLTTAADFWRVPSVSYRLLCGFQRLLLRIGIYGSVRQCWKGGAQTIEGRKVNTRERWELSLWSDTMRRPLAEFEDGCVWVRVRSVESRATIEQVWNLEVDEDDTFCVPFIATHNCKAFSGCLPVATSKTPRYLNMSSLALRGIWLALEAWKTPPPLIVLENVPRIMSRGRHWLDQVTGLLHSYGYAVRETTHDCGELGGLAQRRRRFLLVARHMEQVPEYLYEPPLQRVRGVGEVLGELPVPLPGSDTGGPMHRLQQLSALNWVRLALIPPGGDWRDLPPEVALPARAARQNGQLGVNQWGNHAHTVIAHSSPRDTWASITDPRVLCSPRGGVYGVQDGGEPCGAVTGAARADNGRWTVADPRVQCRRREGGHGVTGWEDSSTAVIAHGQIHNGPWQVADPRMQHIPRRGSMRVEDWAEPSHVVIGDSRANKGQSVADPRCPGIVGPPINIDDKRPCHLVIRAADRTWHRPMTTLELAALQGFPTQIHGEWLQLDGRNQAAWRQRIGNAVPPPAAEAIARTCMATLKAAGCGEFLMGSTPVWVEQRT